MVNNLPRLGRGGNRKPISSREFILEHLAATGEDYVANMHRAYRQALIDLALTTGKTRLNKAGKPVGTPYHRTSYHSFNVIVLNLRREGLIEASGREEESDNSRFADRDDKPERHYYRLKR